MYNDNVTFVTHLRYDHQDRLRNLQTILNYYSLNYPKAKFILVEDDKTHRKEFDEISWPPGRTSFYFIPNDGVYYRTRALNFGIRQAKTPIVVSLDTDCIVSTEAFDSCVNNLMNNSTIAWPYNGYFIDVSLAFHESFIKDNYNFNSIFNKLPIQEDYELGVLTENFAIRCTSTTHLGVGGIVLFNRQRFLEIGGYNEKFICWGAEDNELFERCKILQHSTFRDTNKHSVCFHLFHQNAVRANHPFYDSNFKELETVIKMNKTELCNYIKTWKQFKNEQS